MGVELTHEMLHISNTPQMMDNVQHSVPITVYYGPKGGDKPSINYVKPGFLHYVNLG